MGRMVGLVHSLKVWSFSVSSIFWFAAHHGWRELLVFKQNCWVWSVRGFFHPRTHSIPKAWLEETRFDYLIFCESRLTWVIGIQTGGFKAFDPSMVVLAFMHPRTHSIPEAWPDKTRTDLLICCEIADVSYSIPTKCLGLGKAHWRYL